MHETYVCPGFSLGKWYWKFWLIEIPVLTPACIRFEIANFIPFSIQKKFVMQHLSRKKIHVHFFIIRNSSCLTLIYRIIIKSIQIVSLLLSLSLVLSCAIYIWWYAMICMKLSHVMSNVLMLQRTNLHKKCVQGFQFP